LSRLVQALLPQDFGLALLVVGVQHMQGAFVPVKLHVIIYDEAASAMPRSDASGKAANHPSGRHPASRVVDDVGEFVAHEHELRIADRLIDACGYVSFGGIGIDDLRRFPNRAGSFRGLLRSQSAH